MTLPTATSATGRLSHSSGAASAARTQATSGASADRACTALRARSSESASMASARANRNSTIAASAHWPISKAPLTASVIRKWMLSVKWRSAIQPFLAVGPPARPIDSAARVITGQLTSSCVSQATASAATAATPEAASSQRVRGGTAMGGGAGRWPAPRGCGPMPMSRSAASSGATSSSRWWAVSSRASRLKSSRTTPTMGSSFWRIRRSSVGQSIWSMRQREAWVPGGAAASWSTPERCSCSCSCACP